MEMRLMRSKKNAAQGAAFKYRLCTGCGLDNLTKLEDWQVHCNDQATYEHA